MEIRVDLDGGQPGGTASGMMLLCPGTTSLASAAPVADDRPPVQDEHERIPHLAHVTGGSRRLLHETAVPVERDLEAEPLKVHCFRFS